MSRMMCGMRGIGGGSALYYVNTRSLCSHTQSTSAGVIGASQSASLQGSLRCLVQVIKRLSCSYKTLSTSFSWILPLEASVSGEKGARSQYSTVREEGIAVPMSLLDDMEVCRYRAKLRLELGRGGSTPGTIEGRRAHGVLGKIKVKLESILSEAGFEVIESHVEGPLVRVGPLQGGLVLYGTPDIVLFMAYKEKGSFLALSLEYATYQAAAKTLIYRHALYSVAIYNHYGFPVIPALLVESPSRGFQGYILVPGGDWRASIRKVVEGLLGLLGGDADPPPPATWKVCASCPPRIRGLCPLYGG